jgi:hypothetical protein
MKVGDKVLYTKHNGQVVEAIVTALPGERPVPWADIEFENVHGSLLSRSGVSAGEPGKRRTWHLG